MFDGNRVTAHTRSRYPIFQSPMTWIARAPLVSAVSAAGGMGLLENSIRDLSVTQREFLAIRAATSFGSQASAPILGRSLIWERAPLCRGTMPALRLAFANATKTRR